MENNQLICRITILKRKVEFTGQPLTLGGIGRVCTIPARRRKGLATKLLTLATAELTKAGCEITYLCTDVTNPGMVRLYQKVGFTRLGRPHTFVGKSGKRYRETNAMIAPLVSLDKFKAVMTAKESLDIGVGNW